MLTAVMDEKNNSSTIQPHEFIIKNYKLIANKKILVVNDTDGSNSIFLAQHGYEVTSLCDSIDLVNKNRKLAEKNNSSVNYICSALNDFNLEKNDWDAIIALRCHFTPICRQSFHHRISHALRIKGVYFGEYCSKVDADSSLNVPVTPSEVVSISSIRNELSQLHISSILELEKDISLNTRCECKGHVVQLIAMK